MRVPWTARRTNLSILMEINPEGSLEGQILKLRLQSFGHLMRREDSLEKTLVLGKCEGKRRRGMTEDEMDGQGHQSDQHKFDPTVEDRRAWHDLIHGVTNSWIRLNNKKKKNHSVSSPLDSG